MCVIVVKPMNETVTRRTLKNCWENNSDGGGFVYATPEEEIVISKGYWTFRKFYRAFRLAERENPQSSFILHMRIATSGFIDEINCHPFLINDELAFAHNGIFFDFSNAKSAYSDTWNFNAGVLSSLLTSVEDLYNVGIMALLESYVDSENSKLGILDKYGMYHIVCEGDGDWHNGCWFSNCSYAYGRHQKIFGFHGSRQYTSSLGKCYLCGVYKNEKFMSQKLLDADWRHVCSKCMDDFYSGSTSASKSAGSAYRKSFGV